MAAQTRLTMDDTNRHANTERKTDSHRPSTAGKGLQTAKRHREWEKYLPQERAHQWGFQCQAVSPEIMYVARTLYELSGLYFHI